MNLTILRALFEDARQQVLDNKVFRLLILLTALPILGTFLVGFREDHISFLWGYQVIEYDELHEMIVRSAQTHPELPPLPQGPVLALIDGAYSDFHKRDILKLRALLPAGPDPSLIVSTKSPFLKQRANEVFHAPAEAGARRKAEEPQWKGAVSRPLPSSRTATQAQLR